MAATAFAGATDIKPGYVYVGGARGPRNLPAPEWSTWPIARIAKHTPPLVMPGWTPRTWAARLRQLADRCEPLHPQTAAAYRTWADALAPGAPVAPASRC